MIGRILASVAFLAGGVLMWFILAGLHGYAASQAGMSAGPVSGPPSADGMIPWLVCSYFAISGIGVPLTKNRGALMIVAAFAYMMLFVASCMLCSEASGYDTGMFIGAIIVVGLLALIVFSPWHLIWCRLLFMKRRDAA